MTAATFVFDYRHQARRDRTRMLRRHHGAPCPYCGGAMDSYVAPINDDTRATRDHVVPVSRGGADVAGNIVVVCQLCNWLKGDLLLTEWLDLLRADEDPRARRVAAILRLRPMLEVACAAVVRRERAILEGRA